MAREQSQRRGNSANSTELSVSPSDCCQLSHRQSFLLNYCSCSRNLSLLQVPKVQLNQPAGIFVTTFALELLARLLLTSSRSCQHTKWLIWCTVCYITLRRMEHFRSAHFLYTLDSRTNVCAFLICKFLYLCKSV